VGWLGPELAGVDWSRPEWGTYIKIKSTLHLFLFDVEFHLQSPYFPLEALGELVAVCNLLPVSG
jgi:hypothetical protein